LALVLLTYELARRLRGTGVTANAVHPGFAVTGLYGGQGLAFKLIRLLLSPFASSPEAAAETSIYLASSPEMEDVSGRYFVDKEAVQSAPATYDEGLARQLWRVSQEMTGLDT
jgi:NAD(P)-dependent dehydrogenase (short-subunit alcohol dehydrogenase family)